MTRPNCVSHVESATPAATCSPESINEVYLERSLPGQALKHNGSYAPQVGLGIVALGHNDLRSLVGENIDEVI